MLWWGFICVKSNILLTMKSSKPSTLKLSQLASLSVKLGKVSVLYPVAYIDVCGVAYRTTYRSVSMTEKKIVVRLLTFGYGLLLLGFAILIDGLFVVA